MTDNLDILLNALKSARDWINDECERRGKEDQEYSEPASSMVKSIDEVLGKFTPATEIFDLPADQKSIDWWNCVYSYSRFMYQEAAERGYDAAKAAKANKAYNEARAFYKKVWLQEFDLDSKPADVSDIPPAGVDRRTEI